MHSRPQLPRSADPGRWLPATHVGVPGCALGSWLLALLGGELGRWVCVSARGDGHTAASSPRRRQAASASLAVLDGMLQKRLPLSLACSPCSVHSHRTPRAASPPISFRTAVSSAMPRKRGSQDAFARAGPRRPREDRGQDGRACGTGSPEPEPLLGLSLCAPQRPGSLAPGALQRPLLASLFLPTSYPCTQDLAQRRQC